MSIEQEKTVLEIYFKDLNVECQTRVLEFDGSNVPADILDSTEPMIKVRKRVESPGLKQLKNILIDLVKESCPRSGDCDGCDITECPIHKYSTNRDLGKKD